MAVNATYAQTAGPNNDRPRNFATGRITFDATAITAADYVVQQLGFVPKYIKVFNVTDRIYVEWLEGMAQDTCLKTAANGTNTIETTNKGLSVCRADGTQDTSGRYFQVSQNATLAVIAASKVINWIAMG